jgi:hypothetical protein
MRYEAPELTVLTPAINAIQSPKISNVVDTSGSELKDPAAAYEDWE